MHRPETRTSPPVRLAVAALCLLTAKVCGLMFLLGLWALCGGFGPVDPVAGPLFIAMLFWCAWAAGTAAYHCLTPGRDTTAVVDWAMSKSLWAVLAAISAVFVTNWIG